MNYPCDFSNGLGSPHAIGLLLHYYAYPERHPRADSPLVMAETEALMKLGAIERGDGGVFSTTPMGAAWIRALERCPPPTQVWVDSNGKPLTRGLITSEPQSPPQGQGLQR